MTVREALKKYTARYGVKKVTPTVIKVLEDQAKFITDTIKKVEDCIKSNKDINKNYSLLPFVYKTIYEDGIYQYSYKLKLLSNPEHWSEKDITDYILFTYDERYHMIIGTIGIPIEYFLLNEKDLSKKIFQQLIKKIEADNQDLFEQVLKTTNIINCNRNNINTLNKIQNEYN